MTPRLAVPPAIRVRPAPAFDPPYDDERHPEDEWTIPVPPLWGLAPPPDPKARTTRKRTRTGVPAEIRTTAARFVHTCLEVVNGLRPISQLRAMADPLEAATVLSTMTYAARRLHREARRAKRTGAGAGAGAGTVAGSGTAKVKLRRMRVFQPHPDAIEIAAVIGAGERAWAAAFRLDRRRGRWLCTAAAVL